MTAEAVKLSIHIKIGEVEMEFKEKVPIEGVEDTIQRLVVGVGRQMLAGVIRVLDDRIEGEVPAGWRNVGTEGRWMVSSLGPIYYRRRIYQDEQGGRVKPIDELFGLEAYGRMSARLQEMGAALASCDPYRRAAEQLSYLVKTPISHNALQRMVWRVGNRIGDGEEAERRRIFEGGAGLEGGRIEAGVLYGESDGVWVHLQRERRRSAEVRVAILSTGRKPVGKGRYRLENKLCMTSLGLSGQEWQEHILREAHRTYDLSQVQQLISGGDGNEWVRHSFDRLELPQEFVLDRFHLLRAARRAYPDRREARQLVTRLRREGFEAVAPELTRQIQQAQGNSQKLLLEFYRYVGNNREGLLDLEYRTPACSATLGAIEGNVDKLVVHRMKGRGCSWRLPGARAMLALLRHADQLRVQAYRYLPLNTPPRSYRTVQYIELEYAENTQASMPIFSGPDQCKPWVKVIHRRIYGR